MLPYTSYLRVYEPAAALSSQLQQVLSTEPEPEHSNASTLAFEQHAALRLAVTARPPSAASPEVGCYWLESDGERFYSPVDLPLRSWLSLTSLVQDVAAAGNLGVLTNDFGLADDEFFRWRRDNPHAVAHIRQSTWGVPRSWFAAFDDSERELYDDDGLSSVRYRTALPRACQRLTRAHQIVQRHLDDEEVLEDLESLGAWLNRFDARSRLELDYAGVARYLGPRLVTDRSAHEIAQALEALQQQDMSSLAVIWNKFATRWRVVSSFERAN